MAHRIITINRMYGSGGRLLGRPLQRKLGIGFYDKELIRLASEKNQIPYKELEKVDERKASQWRLPVKEQMQIGASIPFSSHETMFYLRPKSQVIQELAQKEDCIIVGRCANYVLETNVSACLSMRLLNTASSLLWNVWAGKKKAPGLW